MTGRWVGGPDGRVEGRDERLERGLLSSSRWSEEEVVAPVAVDEDVAGPRLVRWEMRVFFGAKGSMKSKHGGRFYEKKK